jgi:hypothetical protein
MSESPCEKRSVWDVLLDCLLIGLAILLTFGLGIMLIGFVAQIVAGLLGALLPAFLASLLAELLFWSLLLALFAMLGWEFIQRMMALKPVRP